MSRIYRMFRRVMPARTRLAWSRSIIERAYASDIAAARLTMNHGEVESLQSSRRHELDLQREEEDEYLTKQLLGQARTLRVPVPSARSTDGGISEHWYEGSQTGGLYLTDVGIKALRDEVRRELSARHESRAQLVVWLSAITGVLGAATGLVAVLQSSG